MKFNFLSILLTLLCCSMAIKSSTPITTFNIANITNVSVYLYRDPNTNEKILIPIPPTYLSALQNNEVVSFTLTINDSNPSVPYQLYISSAKINNNQQTFMSSGSLANEMTTNSEHGDICINVDPTTLKAAYKIPLTMYTYKTNMLSIQNITKSIVPEQITPIIIPQGSIVNSLYLTPNLSTTAAHYPIGNQNLINAINALQPGQIISGSISNNILTFNWGKPTQSATNNSLPTGQLITNYYLVCTTNTGTTIFSSKITSTNQQFSIMLPPTPVVIPTDSTLTNITLTGPNSLTYQFAPTMLQQLQSTITNLQPEAGQQILGTITQQGGLTFTLPNNQQAKTAALASSITSNNYAIKYTIQPKPSDNRTYQPQIITIPVTGENQPFSIIKATHLTLNVDYPNIYVQDKQNTQYQFSNAGNFITAAEYLNTSENQQVPFILGSLNNGILTFSWGAIPYFNLAAGSAIATLPIPITPNSYNIISQLPAEQINNKIVPITSSTQQFCIMPPRKIAQSENNNPAPNNNPTPAPKPGPITSIQIPAGSNVTNLYIIQNSTPKTQIPFSNAGNLIAALNTPGQSTISGSLNNGSLTFSWNSNGSQTATNSSSSITAGTYSLVYETQLTGQNPKATTIFITNQAQQFSITPTPVSKTTQTSIGYITGLSIQSNKNSQNLSNILPKIQTISLSNQTLIIKIASGNINVYGNKSGLIASTPLTGISESTNYTAIIQDGAQTKSIQFNGENGITLTISTTPSLNLNAPISTLAIIPIGNTAQQVTGSLLTFLQGNTDSHITISNGSLVVSGYNNQTMTIPVSNQGYIAQVISGATTYVIGFNATSGFNIKIPSISLNNQQITLNGNQIIHSLTLVNNASLTINGNLTINAKSSIDPQYINIGQGCSVTVSGSITCNGNNMSTAINSGSLIAQDGTITITKNTTQTPSGNSFYNGFYNTGKIQASGDIFITQNSGSNGSVWYGKSANPGHGFINTGSIQGANVSINNNNGGSGGMGQWQVLISGAHGVWNTGSISGSGILTMSNNNGGNGGTPPNIQSGYNNGGNGGDGIFNQSNNITSFSKIIIKNNKGGNGGNGGNTGNSSANGGTPGWGVYFSNSPSLPITQKNNTSGSAGSGGNGGNAAQPNSGGVFPLNL